MPAPQSFAPELLAGPPQLTASQLDFLEKSLNAISLTPGPTPQQAAKVAGPQAGTETNPAGVQPSAPNTLHRLRSTALNTAPNASYSGVGEPSLGQSGRYVFYAGNWYAARSTDGGVTFAYVNPYGGMTDFCCDQDVLVDVGRNMFLWYRQGVYQAGTGQNRFVLGVSTNEAASWCTYSTQPINVNGAWTGQWFDYPHLALSNNYLYISTNMFNAAGVFTQKLLLRWPLDSLATCSGFNYTWWSGAYYSGWGEPAQGATRVMYLGDHMGSTQSFRVLWQPENSNSIFWVDRAIPAWTFENKNGVCPAPDGKNWCAFADSRIQAGWISPASDEVGFMWNAAQGGGFPYPYEESAAFRLSDLLYTSRPFVWNGSNAWQYAYMSPNARGDIGGTIYYGGGGLYPSAAFIIRDDYSPTAPGWTNILLRAGVASRTRWGDFSRVRAFLPSERAWSVAIYTLQKTLTGAIYTEPRFIIVDRGRDDPSVRRWWSY
jgi:hypothetical protein